MECVSLEEFDNVYGLTHNDREPRETSYSLMARFKQKCSAIVVTTTQQSNLFPKHNSSVMLERCICNH